MKKNSPNPNSKTLTLLQRDCVAEFSQMEKNLEAIQVGLKDFTSSTMPMPIAPRADIGSKEILKALKQLQLSITSLEANYTTIETKIDWKIEMETARTQIKKDDNNNDNNNGSNTTCAETVQAKTHLLKMTNQWIRQKQREQLPQQRAKRSFIFNLRQKETSMKPILELSAKEIVQLCQHTIEKIWPTSTAAFGVSRTTKTIELIFDTEEQ